jgi:hypothetical protein
MASLLPLHAELEDSIIERIDLPPASCIKFPSPDHLSLTKLVRLFAL